MLARLSIAIMGVMGILSMITIGCSTARVLTATNKTSSEHYEILLDGRVVKKEDILYKASTILNCEDSIPVKGGVHFMGLREKVEVMNAESPFSSPVTSTNGYVFLNLDSKFYKSVTSTNRYAFLNLDGRVYKLLPERTASGSEYVDLDHGLSLWIKRGDAMLTKHDKELYQNCKLVNSSWEVGFVIPGDTPDDIVNLVGNLDGEMMVATNVETSEGSPIRTWYFLDTKEFTPIPMVSKGQAPNPSQMNWVAIPLIKTTHTGVFWSIALFYQKQNLPIYYYTDSYFLGDRLKQVELESPQPGLVDVSFYTHASDQAYGDYPKEFRSHRFYIDTTQKKLILNR